ncbi:MAG: hypothetical protein Q9196_002453 [Gyalolechia fulgens]
MEGHEPYSELDSSDDEEQIEARFLSRQFPEMESALMNCVTHKCWAGEYDSAEAVLQDLAKTNGADLAAQRTQLPFDIECYTPTEDAQ